MVFSISNGRAWRRCPQGRGAGAWARIKRGRRGRRGGSGRSGEAGRPGGAAVVVEVEERRMTSPLILGQLFSGGEDSKKK
ncbi:hypothetical protein EUGRSUZ_K03204 [Eucalyptus grandis]|uniref:Uncharacterized protein n=2 Tax=Eucalyptus grandis TaxID=71139 RepID=A0ACC3IZC4_EUCGR|nr:hypothetical protein EUGRSUZ_K03204 [Eucalyptus grandis]